MTETTTTLRERALEAHRRNQAEIASDAARREARGREEDETRLREQALRILGDFVPVDGEIVWGANDCGFPRPTVTVDGITFSVDGHYNLSATVKRSGCEHRVAGTIHPGDALADLGEVLERAAALSCRDCEYEAKERAATIAAPIPRPAPQTPGERLVEALRDFIASEQVPF